MERQSFNYILLRFVWKLFSFIPFPALYLLSDILYYPFYYLLRYRRKITRRNLTESFPEKSLKEVKQIEKRFYRFFLDIIVETCKYATISPKTTKKRMKFTNISEINAILNAGKSISLYLGHYANWEWVSSLPLHLDNSEVVAGQIYQQVHNELVDTLLLENRSRMGAICVEMKQTLRWINEQITAGNVTITGYIADQSPRGNNLRYYIDFLNHQAPVLVGTEKITKRYGMEAYYLDIKRVSRGYYEASFVRLTDSPETLPDYKLTEIYYSHLEGTIRRNPELYLWTHNRFRHAKKE